jgi:hypothetical protein
MYKVKATDLSLCLINEAMKTFGGSGGIAPPSLASPLDVSVQLHAATILPPRE